MKTICHLSCLAALLVPMLGLAAPRRIDGEALARHAAAVREKAPAGFTVVIEPPFVVAGDEAPGTVAQRAKRTVGWSVGRLREAYFADDPKAIVTVWLFKNDVSYRQHAKALFDDEPETPYGYYSARHRALVMNIATGGGTLIHEIVHPFMDANFPACPAWFNEGLASLYEQSQERDGQIAGLTNWRLAGLQQAIRAKQTVSFAKLLSTTSDQFYGAGSGLHYAQARYLCYYLQEKGLLRKYYRAFVAAAQDDPSGYATLQHVLGEQDMADFQTRWERWVLDLRFP